jgi:hypothetical protein
MGIFANEPEEGSPGYIGAPARNQPWHGQSGFEAMGHEVPMFRKSAAERHLKQMGFDDAEQRFDIVAKMSGEIERDNSHAAMEAAYKLGLDVTGAYRLLAVLLTAVPPTEA